MSIYKGTWLEEDIETDQCSRCGDPLDDGEGTSCSQCDKNMCYDCLLPPLEEECHKCCDNQTCFNCATGAEISAGKAGCWRHEIITLNYISA